MSGHHWVLMKQWRRDGSLFVLVKRMSDQEYQTARRHYWTPVLPGYGNTWFEDTKWWRHRKGRRFVRYQVMLPIMTLIKTNSKVISWLIRHPLISTIIGSVIAYWLLLKLGWVSLPK